MGCGGKSSFPERCEHHIEDQGSTLRKPKLAQVAGRIKRVVSRISTSRFFVTLDGLVVKDKRSVAMR